jgi:antitoxin component of MazEF toxin-antitoxin module
MFVIPKPILEALDLAADVRVGLSIRGGKLVIDPRWRRYSLDDLLAEHQRLMRRLPADNAAVASRSRVGLRQIRRPRADLRKSGHA